MDNVVIAVKCVEPMNLRTYEPFQLAYALLLSQHLTGVSLRPLSPYLSLAVYIIDEKPEALEPPVIPV